MASAAVRKPVYPEGSLLRPADYASVRQAIEAHARYLNGQPGGPEQAAFRVDGFADGGRGHGSAWAQRF